MPDIRPPAMFIADAPGLDFLNSIATPVDVPVEWLSSGEDFLTWLEAAKLISNDMAATARANALPGELEAVAAQARALRDWFRGFVLAHKGRPLSSEAQVEMKPLIDLLERDEAFGTIVSGDAGFEWQYRRRWRTPGSLLQPIAKVMADLICTADFTLVKACEGHTCTLFFLDTTQRRARRWCSMAVCGNRAKQATHRNRSKKTDR